MRLTNLSKLSLVIIIFALLCGSRTVALSVATLVVGIHLGMITRDKKDKR